MPTQTKPMTFDHLRSMKKPRRKTITLYASDEALELVERRQNELKEVTSPEDRAKAQKNLETAERALKDSEITLVFQSIGRKRYEDLITEHPPTDKQNEESKAETGSDAPYNVDTFPAALISASAVEPELTLEQAQELWDTWNQGEVLEIFYAALEVNTARRSGLGKGFGVASG